jgi:competence protein ComFC
MLKAITDSLFALLYPQACQNCNDISEWSAEGPACSACWEKTRIFSAKETMCAKCGSFLRDSDSLADTFCHHCDDHRYDLARAVGSYEHALAAEIIRLKTTPSVSRKTRDLLVRALDHAPFQDTSCIMPVPLSRKRQLERGFNQAELLAGIAAKHAGIPLDTKTLIRKVHTPIHRAAMDKKARDLTVRNAFAVTRPNLVKDENILLVDDVFTSGATVSYCAKVLKRNGAGKVYVFTLARAHRSF